MIQVWVLAISMIAALFVALILSSAQKDKLAMGCLVLLGLFMAILVGFGIFRTVEVTEEVLPSVSSIPLNKHVKLETCTDCESRVVFETTIESFLIFYNEVSHYVIYVSADDVLNSP